MNWLLIAFFSFSGMETPDLAKNSSNNEYVVHSNRFWFQEKNIELFLSIRFCSLSKTNEIYQ